MSVTTCFSSGTGSGSAAELLSGSFMIPATTSLTCITENDDRVAPGLAAVNVGSGASPRSDQDLIAATLPTKNLLKSSTVIAELAGVAHGQAAYQRTARVAAVTFGQFQ